MQRVEHTVAALLEKIEVHGHIHADNMVCECGNSDRRMTKAAIFLYLPPKRRLLPPCRFFAAFLYTRQRRTPDFRLQPVRIN
jgi:hypothetical protein